MNLQPSSIGLAILLGHLSACDASIGAVACEGEHTRCQDIPFDFHEPLDLDGASIERFPVASSGRMSVRWRTQPCAPNACFALAAPGPDQGVWMLSTEQAMSMSGDTLVARLFGAEGELLSSARIEHPDYPGLAGYSPPTSDARGQLFTVVRWLDDDYRSPLAEVVRVDGQGELARTQVPWTHFELGGPTSFGVMPGMRGFEVFESDVPSHVLRSYTEQAQLSWLQTKLLNTSSASVVDVVRTETGFGLIGSSRIGLNYEIPTLTFMDEYGNAQRGFYFNAETEPKLRALAHDQIAVAVSVRVDPRQDPGAGDIVMFKVDPSGELSGYRLQRTDYHELTLHAFTTDPSDNLFLSTQAGARDALVGLVCRIKVDGGARCFETEPNLTFASLVALDERTLYAFTNETKELLLVELPE